MSAIQLSRKEKMLVHCAPIREERVDDRALRMALHRSRKTDAFALGDFLVMKHRVVRYDVAPDFAELKTIGCGVFDDEEGQRVAQVWVVEKKMQLFVFPAERDPKTGRAREVSGWRSIEQERWAGVVKEQHGACFMAALRGSAKDLAQYVSKKKE